MISRGYKSSSRKPALNCCVPVSPEFELELMEVAVQGAKAFETYWNNNGDYYIISKHVLCYKIYEEIVGRRINLLMERAIKLVERLQRGDKSSHTRALKVYQTILKVWRLKNEAFEEKCNEMLSIDSPRSFFVGQWTSPKESAKTSYHHRRNFPSMSSFQEEIDKAFSSTGDEKQLTRTFPPLSLDDLSSQREASKTDWRVSTDSIIRGEPSNSYSTKRSEPYDTDEKEKHSTKDPTQTGEANIR